MALKSCPGRSLRNTRNSVIFWTCVAGTNKFHEQCNDFLYDQESIGSWGTTQVCNIETAAASESTTCTAQNFYSFLQECPRLQDYLFRINWHYQKFTDTSSNQSINTINQQIIRKVQINERIKRDLQEVVIGIASFSISRIHVKNSYCDHGFFPSIIISVLATHKPCPDAPFYKREVEKPNYNITCSLDNLRP